MPKYTHPDYTIDSQTFSISGGKVRPKKFFQEISGSSIGPAVINVETLGGIIGHMTEGGAVVSGGICRCTFDNTLISVEQSTLDSLVSAHDVQDSPLVMQALLSDFDVDVVTVDYKKGLLGSLHRKEVVVDHGQVLHVEYYLTEAELPDELAIRVCVYKDDALTTLGYNRELGTGFAIDRYTNREWLRKDGSVFASKKTKKVYKSTKDKQKEARRRRQRVIDDMFVDVFEMHLISSVAADPTTPTLLEIGIASDEANALQSSYSTDISNYIRGGDTTWAGTPGISDDSTPWLDSLLSTNSDPVRAAIAVAKEWTDLDIRSAILSALAELG